MIYNRIYVHRRFHVLVTDPNADLFFGMMFRRLPSADRDYKKMIYNRRYIHRRFHVLVTDPNADLFFGLMFAAYREPETFEMSIRDSRCV
ncbi:hypothetical protein HanRHA438_Chr12g0539461 [Helianthus annuus]|nr:hypothetical protein HanRHA438_Chr12g0539461 [Helianthus annuus]